MNWQLHNKNVGININALSSYIKGSIIVTTKQSHNTIKKSISIGNRLLITIWVV